jgi:acetyl esterase/lipase
MVEFQLWQQEGATKIVWHEPKEKKTDACVIVFPGGGYAALCDYEGKDYAEFLNSLGITAFVVYYHIFPDRFPLPLLDARRAVRFVRANAEKFGVATDKVAVMGSSAGGHLCALTSTYTAPIEGEGVDSIDEYAFLPNAQILCYPVVSSDESVFHGGSYHNLLGDRYEEKAKFDPELLATENTPPAFVWHTAEDQLVPVANSCRYVARLAQLGVYSELHVFPFGAHGRALALLPEEQHTAQWKGLLVNWLMLIGWYACN